MGRDDFKDLSVVITGGTGALGRATVSGLLEAGARCHVPVFDQGELEGLPFRDHPSLELSEPFDLSDEGAVEAYYAALPSLWASIHCAGGFAMSGIRETSLADLESQLRLNFKTCFLCCREAARTIPRGGAPRGGRIVNVVARPALEPRHGAGMIPYATSKAAVAALTQALGEELASEEIWVNAVAPSILDTPANRLAMPDQDPAPWTKVEHAAETILFLASPANRATRSGLVPIYGPS